MQTLTQGWSSLLGWRAKKQLREGEEAIEGKLPVGSKRLSSSGNLEEEDPLGARKPAVPPNPHNTGATLRAQSSRHGQGGAISLVQSGRVPCQWQPL